MVERLLADAMLAAYLVAGASRFDLLRNRDDLRLREPALSHTVLLSRPGGLTFSMAQLLGAGSIRVAGPSLPKTRIFVPHRAYGNGATARDPRRSRVDHFEREC